MYCWLARVGALVSIAILFLGRDTIAQASTPYDGHMCGIVPCSVQDGGDHTDHTDRGHGNNGGSRRSSETSGRSGQPCLLTLDLSQAATGSWASRTVGKCPSGKSGVSSRDLYQRALAILPIPNPLIKTAPPRGKRELVNMPTWFWLDKSQWGTRSKRATDGNVWAAVQASTFEIVIDPGDGTEPFTCRAPWTQYQPGNQSSCTHAYTHSGIYTVKVTARWAADWSGSDGDGGTLPTFTRSAQFGVHVVQARSELIANP